MDSSSWSLLSSASLLLPPLLPLPPLLLKLDALSLSAAFS